MRIRINFLASPEIINDPLNSEVNGFVNKLLGENNEYHGKVSNYSVSPMLGYVIDKEKHQKSYPNGGYFNISSPDTDFMSKIVTGLVNITESDRVGQLKVNKMKLFEIDQFLLADYYDIVHFTGGVIVKDEKTALTYKDEKFLEILQKKSIQRLIHNGISEKSANSIKISLYHPEKSRTEMVKVKKQANICNRIRLVVHGTKEARLALYELGMGVSTGFGFGSVSLRESNQF